MKTIKTVFLLLAISWGIGLKAQVPCGITQPYFYTSFNPNNIPVFHDTTTYAAGWLPISYFWDFGDGTTSTLASPSHVFSQPGNFTVCMTVTAQLQGTTITCVDTFCKNYSNCNGMVQAYFMPSQQGGGAVFFNGTGSSNYPPLDFTWTFGDGSSGVGPSLTHLYATNGTYQVCLTVTDSNGCSAQYCQWVQVTSAGNCGNINASFTHANPTQGAVILSSNSTGTGTSNTYQWFMNGVALNNPGPNTNFTVTNLTTGPHLFCLYVYSSTNVLCDSACQIVFVQNGINPCGNVNANFTATSGNGSIAVSSTTSGVFSGIGYQWYISSTNGFSQNTNITSALASYTWNNLPSGVYNVCLYIWTSNQQWCDSTCQTIVVQNSNPCGTVNAQFTYNNSGNTFVFIGANTSTNLQSLWQVNGVTVGQGPQFTYTFTSNPNTLIYQVCHLVYLPGTTCADTVCQFITIPGSGSGCAGVSVSITQNPTPNGGFVLTAHISDSSAAVYAWSNGATTQTISVTAPGAYCVTATNPNNCTATACDSVGSSNPCNLQVVINPQITGSAAVLFVSAWGGTAPYTYLWSNGQAGANPITVNQPGTYCVTAIDANNCTGVACYTFNPTQPATDTICGVVFNDLNGNGIQDAGENGLSGYIYVGNYSVYTDSFGYYSAAVPAGTYNVYYCAPTGYSYTVPVVPNPNALNNCAFYNVVATGGGTHCGYNFGIQNTTVTICGTVFLDANNNGVQNAGETGVSNVHVYITSSLGTVYHAYTSSTGQYCRILPAGTYTITAVSNTLQACASSPQSISVAATTIGQSYLGNNFAIYCQPGLCNLSINATPHTTVTAGFPAWYDVQVCNVGTSVSSGTVNFFYDSELVFDYASPVQTSHNASTRTVSWNLNNLAPGSCAYYWIHFDAITNLQLNQPVFTLVNITPGAGCNDVNMTNNVDTMHQYVTGSWDPNNKLAYTTNTEDNPAQHWISSIEPNQRIEYVVNFQNTGNAPAVNVVIVDEIAAELDENSFELLGTSHPCNVTRTGSMLNFQFPQIMLPDSTNDEPNSHGFIKFAVNATNSLPAGTLIADDAAIYFDYNLPVITNEALVLLIEPSGIDELNTSTTVVVAPNPLSQYAEFRLRGNSERFTLSVMDMTGRLVSESSSEGGSLVLNRGNLSSGIYTYQIVQNGKSSAKGKLVIE